MEQENKNKNGKFLVIAIIFVILLIVITVAVTYAFFKVNTTKTNTLSDVDVSTDCIDITYSESDTINLDYNYPVSDDYALANVVPVTIQVTNNCSKNNENVNYTLAITSLSNDNNYISDNKIRMNVKRKLGSAAETTFKSTNYLNSLTALTSGNAYKYLNDDLDVRSGASSYGTRKSYIIDSNNIANNTINTYKVYLWVDYYEGDTTHTGLNDNSTEGQNFAAAISLVVNGDNNKIEEDGPIGKLTPILTMDAPHELDSNGNATFSYTYNGDGELTCAVRNYDNSADHPDATCNIDADNNTISVYNKEYTNVLVVLSASEGELYAEASISAIINPNMFS